MCMQMVIVYRYISMSMCVHANEWANKIANEREREREREREKIWNKDKIVSF